MSRTQETGTSILEHPEAVPLWEKATVKTTVVKSCERHLTQCLEPYLPMSCRKQHRENATLVLQGLLNALQPETCEPIAREHAVQRNPIRFFVGPGNWDDE